MTTPSSSPDPDDLDYGATLKGLRSGLKVFRRFSLERQLGRGGMGVVWLGRDEELGGREVALKFLPELVQGDESAIVDLKKETLRSLELTHPNIVRIYDWVADEHVAAISMEYVDGHTLSGLRVRTEAGVFEVSEITAWTEQLCAALTYAHVEKKIVHRDLKPSNLMVDTAGRLRVMDFGIAGSLTDSMSRLSAAAMPASGTLVYMSPQQAMGYPPSVADDVYSLGATLYELLTGKPPFYRGNIQHQIETVVPCSIMDRREQHEVKGTDLIPDAWEQTIAACLAKDPKQRPATVAEVWARLNGAASTAERAPKPSQPDTTAPTPSPRRTSRNTAGWKTTTSAAVVAGTIAATFLLIVLAVNWAAKQVSYDRSSSPPATSSTPISPLDEGSTPTAASIRVDGTTPSAPIAKLLSGTIGDSWEYDLSGGETLVMKYVPGGTFTMGSSSTEQAALITPEAGGKSEYYTDETAHRVTLTTDFWIGEHEVTIRDYLRFMNESSTFDEAWVTLDDANYSPVEKSGGTYRMRSGTSATWGDERQPMVMVSWDGATAYCAWLTERAKSDLPPGYRFTLPTEAQWERAARGGTTTMTYAGDLEILGLNNAPALDPIAWYGGNSGLDHGNGLDSSSWPDKQYDHTSAGTHPVGLKRPNAYGIYDMIGNVYEWCSDWYGEDYYTDGQTDPMGPTTGSYRVNRGGSWDDDARFCRAADRYRFTPTLPVLRPGLPGCPQFPGGRVKARRRNEGGNLGSTAAGAFIQLFPTQIATNLPSSPNGSVSLAINFIKPKTDWHGFCLTFETSTSPHTPTPPPSHEPADPLPLAKVSH